MEKSLLLKRLKVVLKYTLKNNSISEGVAILNFVQSTVTVVSDFYIFVLPRTIFHSYVSWNMIYELS